MEDLNWTFIYSLPRICAVSTKIRNFQFKFLHRRIATNSRLSFQNSNIGYSSLLLVQNRRGNTNSSLLGMLSYKIFLAKCERIFLFNPSYTSLARSRHVWMFRLRRRGRWCTTKPLFALCKMLRATENITCNGECVERLKFNFEIEKQVSMVTGSENKFKQRWCKNSPGTIRSGFLHNFNLLLSFNPKPMFA